MYFLNYAKIYITFDDNRERALEQLFPFESFSAAKMENRKLMTQKETEII